MKNLVFALLGVLFTTAAQGQPSSATCGMFIKPGSYVYTGLLQRGTQARIYRPNDSTQTEYHTYGTVTDTTVYRLHRSGDCGYTLTYLYSSHPVYHKGTDAGDVTEVMITSVTPDSTVHLLLKDKRKRPWRDEYRRN